MPWYVDDYDPNDPSNTIPKHCLPILVYLTDEEYKQVSQFMDDNDILKIEVRRSKLKYETNHDDEKTENANRFFRWLFKLLPPDSKMYVKDPVEDVGDISL